MSQAFTRLVAGFVLAAMSTAPVVAATDIVPFDAFGYRDTILERGPNASLSVFLPVTRGLRSVRLRAPLTISPQVDPRSTILITANDIPVASYEVRNVGRTPTIDLAIPVPSDASSLSIAIVGRLFVDGDICAAPPTDVYFTVAKNSQLTVTTDAARTDDQVAAFLAGYGGEFDVVNRAPGDAGRSAAMGLAYRLHQIERWRRVIVRLTSTPAAGTRRVVLGTFPADIAVHGDELDLTPHGVDLLDDQISRMLIARRISDTTYTPAPGGVKKLTIDDLGVTTRTLRGAGELPFDIPVTYGAFGGVPQHLRLHVDLSHTPIHAADRAYVHVLVNNTLVGAYDMSPSRMVERFDVPLDVDAVSSSNVVRIVPTFFYERDACRGNYPSFTATLANDTNFQWDGLANRPLSVGEFVRAVSGKVIVLVDDPSNDGAAFALVSAIGTVNAEVRSIDAQPYTGSVPGGYDYAIVVGSGDHVVALNPPLQVNGQAFTIFAQDGSVRFKADYSEPFGVLETAQNGGTPTLVATYWKDPHVMTGLAAMQPDDLAAQTDNIMVFNGHQATYSDTQRAPIQRADSFALTIPLIIGLFVLLLVVVAVFASRRKA